MGLQHDLTYLHMKAATCIDKIERELHQWRRLPDEPEYRRRITDQIASEALRLRRSLESFFARERAELLPRMERIFGSNMKDANHLIRHQGMVLTALDRFIVTLSDDSTQSHDSSEHQIHLARLTDLFGEFVDRYEARCETDRTFYQTYSTLLYPGGLATE